MVHLIFAIFVLQVITKMGHVIIMVCFTDTKISGAFKTNIINVILNCLETEVAIFPFQAFTKMILTTIAPFSTYFDVARVMVCSEWQLV